MKDGQTDRSTKAAALLVERLVRDAYSDRTPGSVTPLQWAILRCLSRARPEIKTQSWIAAFVGVTPAPVSRTLRALAARGAVMLERSSTDGRQTVVTLTEAGAVLLADDPILAISSRIADLDDDDQIAFRRVLERLVMDTRAKGTADG